MVYDCSLTYAEAVIKLSKFQAVNAELLAACEQAFKLPQPWIKGGPTIKQWNEAMQALETAIQHAKEVS